MALQYSVFLFSGTPEQLDRCLAQLERLMDKSEDDVRAYPLPERGLRWCQGKPLLPEGIFWSGLPAAWQHSSESSESSAKIARPNPKKHDSKQPHKDISAQAQKVHKWVCN